MVTWDGYGWAFPSNQPHPASLREKERTPRQPWVISRPPWQKLQERPTLEKNLLHDGITSSNAVHCSCSRQTTLGTYHRLVSHFPARVKPSVQVGQNPVLRSISSLFISLILSVSPSSGIPMVEPVSDCSFGVFLSHCPPPSNNACTDARCHCPCPIIFNTPKDHKSNSPSSPFNAIVPVFCTQRPMSSNALS